MYQYNSICRGNNFFNDPEYLNRFIKNVESQFRHHPFYNHYKFYLVNDVGLDRCQLQSNISIEVANLEMHHTILTLYDEVLLITKYFLRTIGFVNSFMVLKELINSHKENIIPIVMLTKINHQKYHNYDLFMPIEVVFGHFMNFITKYKEGITYPIIYKIKKYIEMNGNSDKYIALNNYLLSINDYYLSIGGDQADYYNMYNINNNFS